MPNAKSEDIFWADKLATEVIKRASKEDSLATCKSGASPSGAKHIGNMFDVMKAWIVYRAIKRKGYPTRFVLTHDDRDPLRTIPPRLPTLDAKWISTAGEIEKKFSKYIGHPYHTLEDPFDCCESWAAHFSRVWEDGIIAIGVPENEIQFISNNTLYHEGKFDPYIERVFSDIEQTRQVISKFQKQAKPDYVPFQAVCENCGKITTKVVNWDIQNKTVDYLCEAKALAGKYKVEGCGYRGTAHWHDGKLAWRFEWPAQWGIFSVDFEPFGKEHAEGSWPSGKAIAQHIYGIKPPIYHIYEFLLINGEKMAARRGNVYITQEILDIIEPEVFAFFYTKRSMKHRNLDLKRIYHLVDEFERAERIYFGLIEEPNVFDRTTLCRQYESAMPEIPTKPPLRIDYQFAAVVSQFAPNIKIAERMLRQSGHITGKLEPDDENRIAMRLNLARNWVERFVPELKIKINDKVPEEIKAALSPAQRAALADLALLLRKDINQQELHNALYDLAKRHNLPSVELFGAAYYVLISNWSGPRLAPFILALGRERVRAILEQVF
jgi:lysyl-tRNA synthetase class 1